MKSAADPNARSEPPDKGGGYSTRSPRRLHGDIANRIGKAIICEDHAPGDILPGEIEFSERAGVSRTAYREALRMLAAKGLVESRPRTGTRVSGRSRWNLLDPDVVRWFFEDGEPAEYYLRAIFELRSIIEPAAAALAAERRGVRDLADMAAALTGMRTHTLQFDAGREADRDFHIAILRATGNEVLMSLASGISAAVNWTTHFKYSRRHPPRDPIIDHEAVYEAIAASDAIAAKTSMSRLVEQALDDIRGAMT